MRWFVTRTILSAGGGHLHIASYYHRRQSRLCFSQVKKVKDKVVGSAEETYDKAREKARRRRAQLLVTPSSFYNSFFVRC